MPGPPVCHKLLDLLDNYYKLMKFGSHQHQLLPEIPPVGIVQDPLLITLQLGLLEEYIEVHHDSKQPG